MTNTSTLDLTALAPYIVEQSVREDPLLAKLRQETAQDAMARMQIAPEQGQFMAMMVQLIQAQKIIEVGTYTGYSSLCMARALPEKGQLLCCDTSEEWTQIAQRYWKQADVEHKITLILAPAQQTLQALIDQKQTHQFDLIFLDADKENYDEYYELSLQLIRRNGLILLDNTLWGGKVADASEQEPATQAIRRLNQKLKQDERVDISLIPMADGLTLVRKR